MVFELLRKLNAPNVGNRKALESLEYQLKQVCIGSLCCSCDVNVAHVCFQIQSDKKRLEEKVF